MGRTTTFWIGENRHVTVKLIGDRAQIVIRECGTNAQGHRLLSGKKGINLTVDEWCRMGEQWQDITEALKTTLTARDAYLKEQCER